MSKAEKTFLGCILAGILAILSKRIRIILILLIGLPMLFPVFLINIAENYMNGYDISFEYLGEAKLDTEKAVEAEWNRILYANIGEKQWAFIIDSKTEFEEKYEAYGAPSDLVEDFDFDENILLISINRQISAVRLLEKNTVWQDNVPYAFPEFSFKNQSQNNMLYYYKLPRIEITYQNSEGERVSEKLCLWKVDYNDREKSVNGVRQFQYVDWIPVFRKWNWAFEKFNVGLGES